MMGGRLRIGRAFVLPLLLAGGPVAAQGEGLPEPAAKKVSFREDIYPLLASRCFVCHEGKDPDSGVRLDQRDILLGKTGGPALVQPERSAQSRLVQLVAGVLPGEIMPPEGPPLKVGEIALLRAWIDQGVDWDDRLLPPLNPADHWAFQPIRRPEVPAVGDGATIRNPIDAFVAARHEEHGLSGAAEAERRTLIRRLSLDLLGLPPTPEDVEGFVNDSSPRAYEDLVERLLGSPHYGERWGRHWLDVARWAESEGYESNHPRPFAWRYRDYVVESFNTDKPFNRFMREQIAGDEMQPYADEHLIATGFLAAARLSSNEEDKWLQRNDVLVDITNATASAFLGLTMQCAQCHDHKFDPVTQRDYYRFQGFFVKGQPGDFVLRDKELWAEHNAVRPPEYGPARELRLAMFEHARQRRIAEVKKTLPAETLRVLEIPSDERTWEEEQLAREANLKFQWTPNGIEKGIPEEDRKLYQELKKKVAEIEKRMPPIPQTWAFYSPATSPTQVEQLPMTGFYPLPYEPEELERARPHLLIRGDVNNRGEPVDVGWPRVLGEDGLEADAPRPRSRLADWLEDPRNPLTARVWANRVWHYHFGRGIVATPGNFGLRGARPTHPKLLDWLASELIDSGWSTKHLNRLIITSHTYRQSSAHEPANHAIDPGNLWLWHWRPRRLEAEAVRDSMLAVGGKLDGHVGGPSVPEDKRAESVRRSLYLMQRRDKPPQMQSLFDGPVAVAASCSERNVSTTALQPLYLLNNKHSRAHAEAFAGRLESTGADGVQEAFRLALGRPPEEAEAAEAAAFLERQAKLYESEGAEQAQQRALVDFCQALMCTNEFVYIN